MSTLPCENCNHVKRKIYPDIWGHIPTLVGYAAEGHKVLFSSAFYTHALMAFGHPLAQKKGASYICDLGY